MREDKKKLTFPAAVGFGFVTEISTVIVTITQPMTWDASAIITSELVSRTRVNTAYFITSITTVVICKHQFLTLR